MRGYFSGLTWRTRPRRLLAVELLARAVVLLVVCGMCIGARGQSQSTASQRSGSLVFRGGSLIDGTGRPPLENSVIVMQEGKIVGVGQEGTVAIPSGAQVINAVGKTIIPGLMDAHVHTGAFHPAVYLYWGVTTIGDLGNNPAWLSAVRNAINKGIVVGPTIYIAYPIDYFVPRPGARGWASTRWGSGTGPTARGVSLASFANAMPIRRWIADESSVVASIMEAQQLGIDAINLYSDLDPKLRKFAADIAHRNGMPVFSQHVVPTYVVKPGTLTTDDVIDTGFDVHVETWGIFLATFSKEDREKVIREKIAHPGHLMNTSVFPSLAQKMVDRKMFLQAAFVHDDFAEVSKYREEFDRYNTTFLNSPLGLMVPDREQLIDEYKTSKVKHLEEMRLGFEKIGQFLQTFVAKGGKTVAGTGAPAGGSPGVSLHNDLQMFSEAGLSPMQVIQSATLWAQEAWGKGREAGSVEPGKRADLVVLNRNPLDDLSAVREIHMVVKNGKILDREALANWKDPFPQPTPLSYAKRLPIVDELSPSSLSADLAAIPEVIVRGGNFTPQSRVLLNDRFVATKFYDSGRLGITIEPSLLKEPGSYLISVVQPGSGGGISNLWYFFLSH